MAPFSPPRHSPAWIFQAWAAFIISTAGLGLGIVYLPVDNWVKGYMAMGAVFTVGSTLSLAKTSRDLHEEKQLVARLDEAQVERLLADHSALK